MCQPRREGCCPRHLSGGVGSTPDRGSPDKAQTVPMLSLHLLSACFRSKATSLPHLEASNKHERGKTIQILLYFMGWMYVCVCVGVSLKYDYQLFLF